MMTYSEETLELLASGQYEEAKKKFAWALRKDDDDMLYSLAEELYSLGFSTMSKRAYQKLLERYPNEDSLKTALADIAIGEGNDDEALTYLADIAPDSEAYVEALLVSADLYQTQGMFEVSEQKLLEAYRLAPTEEVIWFALAEFYYNIKKYEQATKFYLELIKAGTFELAKVNLVQRLGVAYASDGHFEQALGYLEQIPKEKLDPDTSFQLGFTYQQLGKNEEAKKQYSALRETNPDYATLYPALAEVLATEGNYAQALITVQEGLGVDEYNPNLYQQAADYAQKLGQAAKASDYLKEALALEPDNMTLVLKLSNLYLLLGRDEDNIAFLKSYLVSNESDGQLYWNLGKAYANLDDYQAALEYYDAAYQELDKNSSFLRDASFFYRNAGQAKQALTAVKSYLETNPSDGEMLELESELENW